MDSVFVSPTGQSVQVALDEARILVVDDDAGSSYEGYYQKSLDRLGLLRRTFSVADSARPPIGSLAAFTIPPVIVWMTGNDTVEAMTAAERNLILDHLNTGGSAIISGQNIAEYSDSADLLLEKTLGIRWTGNVAPWLVVGFAGDPIGNGVSYSFGGGAGNQTSIDRLELAPGALGTPTKTLYHKFPGSDTTMLAAARIVGPGGFWTAAFYGFGLEGLPAERLDSLLARSLRFFDQTVTSADPSDQVRAPLAFELSQNYPNPFNPSTTIQFSLPARAAITVRIFDISGRQVRSLLKEEREAGSHSVIWDARDDRGQEISSGVYFYRLEASGADGSVVRQTRKMVLVQ